ncbi:MAG TPA: nicotinate-nicotinamide nucleotide adenylyltransferase [Candidatus Saccharimonadales bacterium]
MARIGIFSGTFDPVHKGHIAFCRAALEEASLDRIVLLPEPEPRGKAHAAPLAHRRAMLELAVQEEPQLSVLQLGGKRFTVAGTLPELERLLPGEELSLLLGSDIVRSFEAGWPNLGELLKRMRLVIGLRAHDSQGDVEAVLARVRQQTGVAPRYAVIGSPLAHTASTTIRTHQATRQVTPRVAAYIAAHQLYATPA